MKRREFIGATAAVLVSPRRSLAQAKPRRIGFLGRWADDPTRDPSHAAWLSGLREKGWIEGKNLLVDYRDPAGGLPALAADLVALTPELIIASGPNPAIALKAATTTIPIVFVAVYDPIAIGLVQSLSHPGGNITGLATSVPGGMTGKNVEILRELVPGATKIALLVNPENAIHRLLLAEEIPRTAGNIGVALPTVEASKAEELDVAFASAVAQHADAIIVWATILLFSRAPELSRSRPSIICPRFISSANSPRTDWSSTDPNYPLYGAVQAAISIRFSKAPNHPICRWSSRQNSSW